MFYGTAAKVGKTAKSLYFKIKYMFAGCIF
jgi:hypothetical protein